jgi:hypothetical protein
MCGIVGSAKLAGKKPGQRLHLVASGKKGELLRIGRADFSQAILQHRIGGLPFDFFELSFSAIAPRLAQQGFGQSCRRILLHDAGGTLRADHTLIQGVIRVSLYVAHFAVPQMHTYAAPAGAHVASGVADLDFGVAQWRGGWIMERCGRHAGDAFIADGSTTELKKAVDQSVRAVIAK